VLVTCGVVLREVIEEGQVPGETPVWAFGLDDLAKFAQDWGLLDLDE